MDQNESSQEISLPLEILPLGNKGINKKRQPLWVVTAIFAGGLAVGLLVNILVLTTTTPTISPSGTAQKMQVLGTAKDGVAQTGTKVVSIPVSSNVSTASENSLKNPESSPVTIETPDDATRTLLLVVTGIVGIVVMVIIYFGIKFIKLPNLLNNQTAQNVNP